jgi:hypothetical protein
LFSYDKLVCGTDALPNEDDGMYFWAETMIRDIPSSNLLIYNTGGTNEEIL